MHVTPIFTLALTGILVGGTAIAFVLLETAPLPRPNLGIRGWKRTRALEQHGLFAIVEPLIRRVAAWLPTETPLAFRSILTRRLRESGDYLGFNEQELAAASVLAGLFMAGAGALLSKPFASAPPLAAVGFGVGICLPISRVWSVARSRARHVTRSLPGVIELTSMCMGAGLDLPGSLRRIAECSADIDQPIVEEIRRVLQELDLGHTRREALLALAERVPTDEIKELVSSVVQSEEKGTPIARVLMVQARTLRLRRSAAAEEKASGAALLLVGPMTLIFACVIALLMGPVVLRVIGGGA
jgi:tight adherence protein C